MDLERYLWEGRHRARVFLKNKMVHQKQEYDIQATFKTRYERGQLVWLNNPKRVYIVL